MGVVTGKGLADLIRESFGVKITALIFVALIIADIGNTATEFAIHNTNFRTIYNKLDDQGNVPIS